MAGRRCTLVLLAVCLCHLDGIDAGNLQLMFQTKNASRTTNPLSDRVHAAPRRRGRTVAFTAVKRNDQANMGINQTIQFEETLLNEGYGFHRYHGLFIAPQCGVYVFTASMLIKYTGYDYEFAIVHQGRSIVASFYGFRGQFSQTIIMRLNTHETVSVRHVKHTGSYHYHPTIRGNMLSTFSGHLLE